MELLTPIAWVLSTAGIFLIMTVVFAFLGIAFLCFAAVLSAVGSDTGN